MLPAQPLASPLATRPSAAPMAVPPVGTGFSKVLDRLPPEPRTAQRPAPAPQADPRTSQTEDAAQDPSGTAGGIGKPGSGHDAHAEVEPPPFDTLPSGVIPASGNPSAGHATGDPPGIAVLYRTDPAGGPSAAAAAGVDATLHRVPDSAGTPPNRPDLLPEAEKVATGTAKPAPGPVDTGRPTAALAPVVSGTAGGQAPAAALPRAEPLVQPPATVPQTTTQGRAPLADTVPMQRWTAAAGRAAVLFGAAASGPDGAGAIRPATAGAALAPDEIPAFSGTTPPGTTPGAAAAPDRNTTAADGVRATVTPDAPDPGRAATASLTPPPTRADGLTAPIPAPSLLSPQADGGGREATLSASMTLSGAQGLWADRLNPTSPATFPGEPRQIADTARSIAAQIAPEVTRAGAGFELALAPEELGKVRLTLVSHDAGSILHVLAERPETLDLLRRHIAILEQDLRALGHESLSLRFSGGEAGADPRSALPRPPAALAEPDPPATPRQFDQPGGGGARPASPDHLDLRL